jgi:3-oxoacyl-[acyl-carrier-protein] synthase II
MKRVVITGMGAITPIGNNVPEFWDSLSQGKHGIQPIQSYDASAYLVHLAAELKGYKAEQYFEPKEAKRLDPFVQYALISAKEALLDAKLTINDEIAPRVGVIIGSGIGGIQTIQHENTKANQHGFDRISPFFVPMSIANMASGNVSIMTGAKGLCSTSVTACASAANSIGDAFRSIKHGYHDVMISGGSEASINQLAISGFTSSKALHVGENPDKASTPFSLERSGFVMGEGAGVLILESLDFALARGASIYAEIVGYGSTGDAFHITAPPENGEGAARCMALALSEADLSPSSVDYINAHGTSTPMNDAAETAAIKQVFGEKTKVAISSTKSMTGHLLGASGAVEAIACIKAIKESYIPPTANYGTPDPLCDLDVVPNKGRSQPVKVALSNSLGFGGHNATLVFREYVR